MIKRIAFTVSLILLGVSSAQAGTHCGRGFIHDLKEGGWNLDGLHVELKGQQADLGNDTKRANKYIYFDPNFLTPERMAGIRRIASLAFAMKSPVWTFSHNSDCTMATELSVLDQTS
jgi:hypothetical protein